MKVERSGIGTAKTAYFGPNPGSFLQRRMYGASLPCRLLVAVIMKTPNHLNKFITGSNDIRQEKS
jgi:hypothetical protein